MPRPLHRAAAKGKAGVQTGGSLHISWHFAPLAGQKSSSVLTPGKSRVYRLLMSACLQEGMFEAKITVPGGDSPAGETEGLTELGWRDLSVRFAMAREFRQVLGGKRQGDRGSFNLASARHLAAFWDGNPAVNPIALSNGKIADGKGVAVSRIPETGDRGK